MVQLFHYHWWTPKLEEMERFYHSLGFQTVIRVGKYQGQMEAFHPPLTWADFREKAIQFRIIEMRKGKTNLTFGQGKRNQFDHIGFLVDEKELRDICERAYQMKWRVNIGERRTFIGTPWRLRIELQKRHDVVDHTEEMVMKEMEIALPFHHSPTQISQLFQLKINQETSERLELAQGDWGLTFLNEPKLNLKKIAFKTGEGIQEEWTDPMNTTLLI